MREIKIDAPGAGAWIMERVDGVFRDRVDHSFSSHEDGEILGGFALTGYMGLAMSIHMAAGLTVIGLLAIRIVWRVTDPPPPPIATPLGNLLISISKFAHFALYALLAATPAVGILVQFARGDALPLYGLVEIASPWVRDRAFAGSMKEIHETLANLLMILAVVHATAACVHHWIFRDRTLARMLPGIAR